MTQEQKQRELDDYITLVLSQFSSSLSSVLSHAQNQLLVFLAKNLTTNSDGTVRTNTPMWRRLPRLYRKYLSDAGYDFLMMTLMHQIDGGLPILSAALADTAARYFQRGFDLPEDDPFKYKVALVMILEDAIDKQIKLARQRTLLASKETTVATVIALVVERLQPLGTEMMRQTTTGIEAFYRSLAAEVYERLERATGNKFLFKYAGPLDRRNRPFCLDLASRSRNGETWTLEQMDKMRNGQIEPVRTFCGGFNCRHHWAPVGLTSS